jgi:hypothetical protein
MWSLTFKKCLVPGHGVSVGMRGDVGGDRGVHDSGSSGKVDGVHGDGGAEDLVVSLLPGGLALLLADPDPT